MQSTPVRVLVGAVLGAVIGLVVGLIAMQFAPENGFGDLAVAAVMTVFLIPGGLVIGAGVAFWRTRRQKAIGNQ